MDTFATAVFLATFAFETLAKSLYTISKLLGTFAIAGRSLRSECSHETNDFGSGLGNLGFVSGMANVSKCLLMLRRSLATVSEANVAKKLTKADKRKSKTKNLFEVAKLLPNGGVGSKMAKTHWRPGSFYKVTEIKLYKVPILAYFRGAFLRFLMMKWKSYLKNISFLICRTIKSKQRIPWLLQWLVWHIHQEVCGA